MEKNPKPRESCTKNMLVIGDGFELVVDAQRVDKVSLSAALCGAPKNLSLTADKSHYSELANRIADIEAQHFKRDC